jgi:hypothetical protein
MEDNKTDRCNNIVVVETAGEERTKTARRILGCQLICFKGGQFIIMRRYRVHTRCEILTYNATIFSKRWKTSDHGRIQPNNVM